LNFQKEHRKHHMIYYIRSWFMVKKGEKGQDLAEYALLIGLIALIVILVVSLLGQQLSIVFQNVTDILGDQLGISP
jgi:pilus assembly protein Flp/PilA